MSATDDLRRAGDALADRVRDLMDEFGPDDPYAFDSDVGWIACERDLMAWKRAKEQLTENGPKA